VSGLMVKYVIKIDWPIRNHGSEDETGRYGFPT
jgi:hypothetical protein